MEVYTSGFTKKTAAQFFGSLRQAGIKRLVDIRLNNSSQLAGFAKKDDLPFFLNEICDIEYVYEPLLAPTQDMLDTYKKHKGNCKVDPFVKTGGRAVVRATLLLFLPLYFLYENEPIGVPVEYT